MNQRRWIEMTWHWYTRGGWQIAVDAVSKQDAAEHIKRHAPGAEYRGEYPPPSMASPSIATAMTTAKRQEQISNKVRGGV
jgi:hypothetical protein